MFRLATISTLSNPFPINDNPCLASRFKTLRYRPAYPLRTPVDLAAARTWVTTLVPGYHHEHRHSPIHLVTLGPRHPGLDTALPAPHDNLCIDPLMHRRDAGAVAH